MKPFKAIKKYGSSVRNVVAASVFSAGAFLTTQAHAAGMDTTAIQTSLNSAQSDGLSVGAMVVACIAAMVVVSIIISVVKKA